VVYQLANPCIGIDDEKEKDQEVKPKEKKQLMTTEATTAAKVYFPHNFAIPVPKWSCT
jgi:hypothetical protein